MMTICCNISTLLQTKLNELTLFDLASSATRIDGHVHVKIGVPEDCI
jgi:hypothetical protein